MREQISSVEVNRRLEGQAMSEWDRLVEEYMRSMGLLTEETTRASQEMKEASNVVNNFYTVLTDLSSEQAEQFKNLGSYLNSLPGQIQNTQNTIAILQQTLAMFGSNMDVLRKMELEQRIRELTDALIGMQEEWEKRFIVETNGPAVFEDPGLQTPDQADSRRGGITLSFPNITRVSQSEAGTLVDAMNGELRRRGSRI